MRTIQLILFCAALGGCSSSIPRQPEAALSTARPADQFVGKNLDALVAQLGPPTGSLPSDNDQTTVVWQFEAPTGAPPVEGAAGLYGDGNAPGYVSEGYSPFCRITAIVSTSSGVVTQAHTEESNGTGASWLHRDGACARHLRAKSRT